MKLLIVIVCYKAADLTIDCLRSLSTEVPTVPGTKVAVCENGTGEDSVRELREAIEREAWGDWVWLKPIEPNRGFAGGNNAILDEALTWEGENRPDYFMLLNADTVVRPGALASLVSAAEKRPHVGIMSPRLEWPDGTPQVSCFRFQSPVGELIYGAQTGPVTRVLKRFDVPQPVSDESVEVEWVSFACALIRREALEQIGTLDEGFFLYFDDPDYCRRAWNAGWRVRYWPSAHVVHLRGRSNPVKSLTAARKRRPSYYYNSRARFLAKHYGRAGLWLGNLLWTLGRAVSLPRELVGHKQPHVCEREWRDIWTRCHKPMQITHTIHHNSSSGANGSSS